MEDVQKTWGTIRNYFVQLFCVHSISSHTHTPISLRVVSAALPYTAAHLPVAIPASTAPQKTGRSRPRIRLHTLASRVVYPSICLVVVRSGGHRVAARIIHHISPETARYNKCTLSASPVACTPHPAGPCPMYLGWGCPLGRAASNPTRTQCCLS